MLRFLITMCVAVIASVAADGAQKLDLKSIAAGDFRGESIAEITPLADGETYAQISADQKRIEQYSFKTGKLTATLLNLETIRVQGGRKVETIDGYILSPKGDKMLIETNRQAIYRRSATADYYIYEMDNNRLVPLDDKGGQQAPMFSPDGTMIAFVREGNIFLVKMLYDNALSQVTKDGKQGEVINGLADWVYEEEFSTTTSMVFTADSRQLCWIRFDETAVKEYSIQLYKGLNPSREANLNYPGEYRYKYPKAGEDNSKVSAHSFDIKSKKTSLLQVPLEPDGYMPRIEATADPTKIAIFTMNRHQDCMRIYTVNPLSTEAKLVIEDKVDKYIKEESMRSTLITPSGIVLASERDGWNHLYLYTLTGQLKRRITQGEFEVKDVYGYDEATGDTYYASNQKGWGEKQVYVAHLNGKTECLTPQAGFNTALFSSTYKYFINTWSDLNTPPVISIISNKGKALTTLVDNHELKAKWAKVEEATREMFNLTTSEGVELAGWMVKPAGFNPSKKYPVIMYQYGGPGNQQVQNRWSIGGLGQGAVLEQYMAQEGYVVVCVDGRGTGGRGAAFEKSTYLRLGEQEAADQVETALWLGRQTYVDADRIGIWGWSYGGWNTLMSMSEGRPVFKAGVAVAPPTCWRYYDTVYTERYMRTPNENPSGYDDVNPISRASKLSGALLLCHGMADDNVHLQNSVEYAEALVQADKDFKELFYANRNHGIAGGNTHHHLFRQIMGWFEQNMKD